MSTEPLVGSGIPSDAAIGAGKKLVPQRRPGRLHVAPPAPDYRAPLSWQRRLVLTTVLIDLLSVLVAVGVLLALGSADAGASGGQFADKPHQLAFALSLPVLWLVCINLSRAHEPRFLGLGSEEFKRVFDATVRLAALIALVLYGTQSILPRSLVAVTLPTAMLLDLLGRYALRKWVHRRRREGAFGHRVLVVGNPRAVAELARTLQRTHHAGMGVVGSCLDELAEVPADPTAAVPVLGSLADVADVVRREGITTVAVASGARLDSTWLRSLAWSLEGTDVDLLVAPALTDCVGPRIHIRPVAGLPLLHVEEPQLRGGHWLLKSLYERLLAAVALVLLSPLLIFLALSVRIGSKGPALFHQVRIGRDGRAFMLHKFRTMHVDAEARLAELRASNDHADGLLFKMRSDPRITRVGALLRKYSLDELPQLFNVVRGDMSLVGPRPPLPGEVEKYGDDVRRRLKVPPGLTGLWQVSGRADLDWEESVRLDLFYVENWSLALDLMILWKTVPAVLRHTGAY